MIHTHTYVHTYIHIYVYIYIYIYIYTYIHTYICIMSTDLELLEMRLSPYKDCIDEIDFVQACVYVYMYICLYINNDHGP